jgi:Ser/Thr protein kinase RdoA (MazF antagonist)
MRFVVDSQIDAKAGAGAFSLLKPDSIIRSVENVFSLVLDGVLTPYPSYINRVFGLVTEDGVKYVVKFYRPGRWSEAGLREEHQFLFDCHEAEIPVVTPVPDSRGETLHRLALEEEGVARSFFFSLFPLRAGRNFEANTDNDWIRLGGLLGRVHGVGKNRACRDRLSCLPEKTTRPFIDELESSDLVTPEEAAEFYPLLEHGLGKISPLFRDISCQRIHGDCHAGNILDRREEGLLLFDFDDMMAGPAVQDIWLLLPDHADRSRRELALLLKGYEQFNSFEHATLKLIEPLRYMRMVYFLLWCARQKTDYDFYRHFPDWGTKAFWIREIEDFRYQVNLVDDL